MKKIEKSLTMPKKTERGDPLVKFFSKKSLTVKGPVEFLRGCKNTTS